MGLFDGAQHEPFRFEADTPDGRGALLLHGFTGTPAEMRPLGEALAAAGVTAVCPLLPGFGREIDRLGDTKHAAWIEAARTAWAAIEAEFPRTTLVGFSMGGAVALHLAAERPPDKLILLAPFWKLAERGAALLPLLAHVKGSFLPYEHADFTDPMTRDGFLGMDPTLDLDDPEVRARLRTETAIPTGSLVELQRLGRSAIGHAEAVAADTLVVQGLADDTSLPANTRKLIGRLPGNVQLLEVEGDHQLVRANRAAWPQVRDAVVRFATAPSEG